MERRVGAIFALARFLRARALCLSRGCLASDLTSREFRPRRAMCESITYVTTQAKGRSGEKEIVLCQNKSERVCQFYSRPFDDDDEVDGLPISNFPCILVAAHFTSFESLIRPLT